LAIGKGDLHRSFQHRVQAKVQEVAVHLIAIDGNRGLLAAVPNDMVAPFLAHALKDDGPRFLGAFGRRIAFFQQGDTVFQIRQFVIGEHGARLQQMAALPSRSVALPKP